MAEKDVDVSSQDELDDELEEARATPEEQRTRKEKRNNRVKEFEERARRAEEQARVASEQMTQMNATLAQMIASQSEKSKVAEEDPIAKLEDEREKRMASYAAISNPTPEQAKSYLADDRLYERRLREMTVEQAVKKMTPAQQQRTGSPLVELFKEANQDVFSNPKAHKYMGALYQVHIDGGDPIGIEELNEMAEKTRAKFGIAGRPRPTEAGRSKFSSHGSMVGGGQSSEPVMKANFSDPATKKMVRAYAQRVGITDEAEAMSHWLKTVGKKMNSKKE